jgi:3-polyprenyl-4-hydroxybenzoate decarboxylase
LRVCSSRSRRNDSTRPSASLRRSTGSHFARQSFSSNRVSAVMAPVSSPSSNGTRAMLPPPCILQRLADIASACSLYHSLHPWRAGP